MPEFLKDPKILASFLAILVGLTILLADVDTTLAITLLLGGFGALGVSFQMNRSSGGGGPTAALGFLAATALLLGACAGPRDCIRASALEGTVRPVIARHDAYVEADPTLDQAAKDRYLRSTELIEKALQEALKGQ